MYLLMTACSIYREIKTAAGSRSLQDESKRIAPVE